MLLFRIPLLRSIHGGVVFAFWEVARDTILELSHCPLVVCFQAQALTPESRVKAHRHRASSRAVKMRFGRLRIYQHGHAISALHLGVVKTGPEIPPDRTTAFRGEREARIKKSLSMLHPCVSRGLALGC